MSAGDSWGADPAVRAMRQVFAAMEQSEGELLARLGLTGWDPRLRPWRERAQGLFHGAWARALAQGLARDPQEAAKLYLLALGRVMGAAGLSVPPEALPDDPALAGLVEGAGL